MRLEFHPAAELEFIESAAYDELQVPGLASVSARMFGGHSRLYWRTQRLASWSTTISASSSFNVPVLLIYGCRLVARFLLPLIVQSLI